MNIRHPKYSVGLCLMCTGCKSAVDYAGEKVGDMAHGLTHAVGAGGLPQLPSAGEGWTALAGVWRWRGDGHRCGAGVPQVAPKEKWTQQRRLSDELDLSTTVVRRLVFLACLIRTATSWP